MKTYKNIDYLMIVTPMGHFVAYIKLPDHINDIDIAVHGGITFDEIINENSQDYWQKFTPGHWIGWDYAHAGDYSPSMRMTGFEILTGHQWQPEEVEEEIHEAIDQIVTAEAYAKN